MTSQFMPNYFSLPQHELLDITQQQTILCPVTPPLPSTEQSTQPLLPVEQFPSTPTELPSHDQIEDGLHDLLDEDKEDNKEETHKKPGVLLLPISILALIGLGCAIYFIWRTPTNSPAAPILSQSSSPNTYKGNTTSSTTTNAPDGAIQVYVAGAVQHPGVYTLDSDARVYQLLQAAGGPLPNANLVTLNLAAKLADGQEVYVSQIGETPPILGSTNNNSNNQAQLVNINTASATDLEQKLHVSTKSAQNIINYRQQHGSFKSVDQLLQVVSQTIYNKIKGLVTV